MAKRTYRYFGGEALYPFGYGLSYTTFRYGKATVDKETVAAKGEVTASLEVENAGAMAGDEVVQLYLTHAGVPGAPIRALKGFQRIHLDRGERKTVSFVMRDRDLSIVDEAGKHRIVPGKVDVWIGGGQPLGRSNLPHPVGGLAAFTILDESMLPD